MARYARERVYFPGSSHIKSPYFEWASAATIWLVVAAVIWAFGDADYRKRALIREINGEGGQISTVFSGPGWQSLKSLTNLWGLRIESCPNISDAGLVYLGGMTHLHSLVHGDNLRISDADHRAGNGRREDGPAEMPGPWPTPFFRQSGTADPTIRHRCGGPAEDPIRYATPRSPGQSVDPQPSTLGRIRELEVGSLKRWGVTQVELAALTFPFLFYHLALYGLLLGLIPGFWSATRLILIAAVALAAYGVVLPVYLALTGPGSSGGGWKKWLITQTITLASWFSGFLLWEVLDVGVPDGP